FAAAVVAHELSLTVFRCNPPYHSCPSASIHFLHRIQTFSSSSIVNYTTKMSILAPSLRAAFRPVTSVSYQTVRHESTTRRMTKKLRLPPAASFKIDASSPEGTHIIYNPPPTAASVRQTPA